jgi:hypothetical protein
MAGVMEGFDPALRNSQKGSLSQSTNRYIKPRAEEPGLMAIDNVDRCVTLIQLKRHDKDD